MRRLSLVVALFGVFAVACGGPRVHIVPPEDRPRDLYPEGQSGETSRGSNVIILYLVEGNQLVAVERTGTANLSEAEIVVRALLSGPTNAELERDFTTAIPEHIELIGVSVDSGVAEVDFTTLTSERFDNAELDVYLLRLAQVVYSLTELDAVDSVLILDSGQPVTLFNQDGDEIEGPVARGRFDRFHPRSKLGNPKSTGPLRLDVQGPEEAATPEPE